MKNSGLQNSSVRAATHAIGYRRISREFLSALFCTRRLRASVFIVMLIGVQAVKADSSCSPDAKKEYCRFFAYYSDQRQTLDSRIADRLHAKTTDDSRSIALIVGNWKYPQISSEELTPARLDVEHLTSFLSTDQKFDEVIVLENADATVANIRYFLDVYVPSHVVIFNKKSRFLFAYSGHGVPASVSAAPSLLLSSASSLSDTDNLYSMAALRTSLENLASYNFHVLALINACYSGNVFGLTNGGGNPSVTYEPGSFALTAGPSEMVVASLGRPGDGSIFFDSLIKGVKTGEADRTSLTLVDQEGNLIQQGGVISLGLLTEYLTQAIENLKPLQLPSGVIKLKAPWIGPIEPQGTVARGGFFFLSPIFKSNDQRPDISVPAGPSSSIPGRPDIKVFGAFNDYPVRGIDISRAEADIDWAKVARSGITFSYMRAVSSHGADPRFKLNWDAAGAHNLDRGAYLVYSYCQPVDGQIKRLAQVLPSDPSYLPVAIDVEIESDAERVACPEASSVSSIRQRVFGMAESISTRWGKIPLVYGNRATLALLNDGDRFNKYMIWFALYTANGRPPATNLSFSGSNPWTLWQYTATSTIPGIGRNVDSDAFFGTRKQYDDFRLGKMNVAREQVRSVVAER